MSSSAKKRKNCLVNVDTSKLYDLKEALSVVKNNFAYSNFDQSVDFAINLNTDPKNSEQSVRGSAPLPSGTGKKVVVAAFVSDDKVKEAEDAGSDYVGSDDLIEKIKNGLKVDKCVATPNMMQKISKIARILGPKGLMPNPKLGTVTNDISDAVANIKKGQLSFRADKGSIIHASVGKVSFSVEDLYSNFCSFYSSLLLLKPKSLKGGLVSKVTISSTMSPSLVVDLNSLVDIK